jgi:hypothetical protein
MGVSRRGKGRAVLMDSSWSWALWSSRFWSRSARATTYADMGLGDSSISGDGGEGVEDGGEPSTMADVLGVLPVCDCAIACG